MATATMIVNGRPAWEQWQHERPTREQMRAWFVDGTRSGLGIVTGAVSGNVELFEFDDGDSYELFMALAATSGLARLVERIEAGYLEATPGDGFHWLYICEDISGNTKLASRPKRPEGAEASRSPAEARQADPVPTIEGWRSASRTTQSSPTGEASP